ncbi:hypothetical protein OIU34_24335 [Pararhizobium sp. BT-229]|uniref:hypothetical protein n=1 Tax=Pararhizobium sp. BT-229 TaxID=2986923 RepID=UPI0021F7F222|nr:hypothetical protein [Pararhizobium sp. BT-229]MCV9965029.1 hypothetical protein [Pararhizobium sp. BT-229]
MLTDIRYPIHFGGQPTTTDRYKVVLCSFPLSVDVPEIGAGEARTVIETASFFPTADDNAPVVRDIKLFEHDGRLFKKVCDRTEAADHASLKLSFESSNDRNKPHHPASLWEATPRPLGAGMWNRIAHRVYVAGNGREQERIAWPNQPFNTGTARHWTRNEFTFEKWSKKLGQYDVDGFERSVEEARREAERLLWIGDELWVETPPLVYEVGHYAFERNPNFLYDHQDYRSGGGGLTKEFCVQLAFLPDWLDHNLDRQYFPLSAKADALSYAMEANRRLVRRTDIVHDATKDMAGLDVADPLLDFDPDAYSLSRAAMLMAGDVSVNIAKYPDNSRGLTTSHHAAIEEAKDYIATIGWNTSEWAAAHLAGDVVDAWQVTRRPPGWSQFPSNRTNFANMICERAIDQLDTVPVMIPTARRGFAP